MSIVHVRQMSSVRSVQIISFSLILCLFEFVFPNWFNENHNDLVCDNCLMTKLRGDRLKAKVSRGADPLAFF